MSFSCVKVSGFSGCIVIYIVKYGDLLFVIVSKYGIMY